MKHLILLMSTLVCNMLAAQTIMKVHQKGGTVTSYPVSDIDSITFLTQSNTAISVVTHGYTNVTATSMSWIAEVTQKGASNIISRGICYDTSPLPTLSKQVVTNGSGLGSYTTSITGLTPNTTYYGRAFAINSTDTAYGSIMACTTFSPSGSVDVTPVAIPLFGQLNGSGFLPHFSKLTDPFNTFTIDEFAAQKAQNIDLVFYYGNSNWATITSPSDAVMHTLYSGLDWTGSKNTMLYKTTMTVSEFDAFVQGSSDSAIVALASAAVWTTSVNKLTTGNIILFKTTANKLGLIKVENLTGTSGSDAEINLKIVSQEN